MINCLILEDEQDAQALLLDYIKKVPALQVMGMFESGLDVPIELLSNVDLLFLDIQLPELSGIQYLKSLDQPPKVIITSAYPDFAIDAFDLAVADYLLKPYSFERFYKSISRVIKDQSGPTKTSSTIFIYADKTTYKIDVSDILYIKAEVDYVRVKTVQRDILVLDSLKNWNEKLSLFHFTQIHRSYIVNMDRVESISGNQLFLKDDQRLPIGVTFKERVLSSFVD